MESLVHWWLTAWLYVIAAAGVVLVVTVVVCWRRWTSLNRLCTLALIVLVCHVWEEWVLPGGFHVIYNVHSPHPDRYPMSELTDMITNFGGVVVGCLVLVIWGFRQAAGLSIGLFSMFEVVVHVLLAFQSRSTFGPDGQTALYAPGLVTALLGFLPVAVALLVYFVRHRPTPGFGSWARAAVALVGVSFLLVQLPELVLKNEDTPYRFPDTGYYERFGVDADG